MMANIPIIKKYLTLHTEHNYSKSKRIADMLKSVGDKNGLNVFLIKRISLAIVAFILTNTVALTAVARSKEYITNDFAESYSNALVPNEEYRDVMRRVSYDLNDAIVDVKTTREAVEEYAMANNLDETMASMVADELMERQASYGTHYYKWWMLIISLAAAVLCYNIPYMLLRYKQSFMQHKREDEVAQFRTLILILMHEDGMTIDTVLEWMERFAHAFKSSISDCIINLEYSQTKALEKMKEEESGFAPFRRLCDSLISVDKVGLEGAFDDLETERDYYQEKRKLDNEAHIRRCSRKASKIMMIPVWLVLVLYLLVPFGIYVINMLLNFTAIVQ